MYITTDGAEVVHEDKYVGAGFDLAFPRVHAGPHDPKAELGATPRSIESVDVKKAGVIVTDTPDGRMVLRSYLDKVEDLIKREVMARRHNIETIRAKMAKNQMLNQKARAGMKKALLAKMAKNAKIANDELHTSMRKTQAEFAKQAALNNKRWRRERRRDRKTMKIMRKNKLEAQHELNMAVLAQQRQLSALKSATNKKIHHTEKNIAANGAQIKANAKAAKAALDKAMHSFDKKMANAEEEAKKGRSKLAAQAAAQDKAFRNSANNKIKEMVAQAGAKFAKVRAKMAADRHKADHDVSALATKMNAALSAEHALQDKRFKKTVSNIKDARAEAAANIAKCKSQFKNSLHLLTTTVKSQVADVNAAQDKLAHTVKKNAFADAEENKAVHDELARMMKTGNERYEEHLKKDKELHSLLAKNQQETKDAMRRMADAFTEKLGKIHKQMEKDRVHQSNALKSSTDTLFATMSANQKAQGKVNAKLAAATKAAAKDAADALNAAKLEFTDKLAKMHAVCVKTAKRQQEKIDTLTETVRENALKDAKGRADLKKQQKANKLEIHRAITKAINKGEARALQIEKRQKAVNKKMRATLNNRIDAEVSELRKQTQASLYTLSLDTKAARALMRKEVEAALTEAKDEARAELKKAVQWATGKFAALDALLEGNAKTSAKERGALSSKIASEKAYAQKKLQEAVDKQARAVLAFDQEVNRKLKKAKGKTDKYAILMMENAKKAEAELKTDVATLTTKIEAAKKTAESGLAAAGAASIKRYEGALAEVTKGLASAEKHANDKFGKLYAKMGQDRADWDAKYASAIQDLNDALAQQAALENEQFTKKIPEALDKLRADSAARVSEARKFMTTSMVALTATIKAQETKLQGEIAIVSKQIIDNSAAQARVNAKVTDELKTIEESSNKEASTNKRFHKEIKVKVDANKAAAAEEVAALAKSTKLKIGAIRSKMAADSLQAKQALTKSTEDLYAKLAEHEKEQAGISTSMNTALSGSKAAIAGKLAGAKKDFTAKVNTLTNLITASNKKYEEKLESVTGVVHDWKAASLKDRDLIKDQVAAMDADLNKAIVRAIQLGEAKQKAVESEAMASTDLAKQVLLTTMSEQIEDMADEVFSMVQGNRKTIADNYLSLKAYAEASQDALTDYVTKGKGRNLASVGDLLSTISQAADIKVGKAEGVGAGADTLPLLFSGKTVGVKNPVNQINFLVNEYTKTLASVQARWPSGLGKYLLSKVESNMQEKGVLEVDHIEGKSGNYVFINAHAVGLSSKLSDFEKLAVHMDTYQSVLSKMTKKAEALPGSKKTKELMVGPPEWQGN
jgi:hypothetical protein